MNQQYSSRKSSSGESTIDHYERLAIQACKQYTEDIYCGNDVINEVIVNIVSGDSSSVYLHPKPTPCSRIILAVLPDVDAFGDLSKELIQYGYVTTQCMSSPSGLTAAKWFNIHTFSDHMYQI